MRRSRSHVQPFRSARPWAQGLASLLLAAACFLLNADAARAALSADERNRLLSEASAAFTSGVSLIDKDRAAGLAALNQSIDAFARLSREGPVRNGRLYYNMGTAHLLRGDLGRAILFLRRAQQLIPGDANLVQNLAQARSRVETSVDASAQQRARSALFFWRDAINPATRFWALIAVYLGAWALAGLRATGVLGPRAWWGVGALVLVGAALGASLAADAADQSAGDAVVIAPSVIGRKGPDDSAYQASFTAPLTAGVEVVIVERRPGWVLARLADARQTWLPASAVEPVFEPAGGPDPAGSAAGAS